MIVKQEKLKVKDNILQVRVPNKLKGKLVNITIEIEDNIIKYLLIDKIKIKTSHWKFNRNEIYEK